MKSLLDFFLLFFLSLRPILADPQSQRNSYLSQLKLFLSQSQLSSTEFKFTFHRQVEFSVTAPENNSAIKIVLDPSGDPHHQTVIINKILTYSRQKQKKIKLINLGASPPYVTLANN